MDFSELDRPEYTGIPVYPMGDGTPCDSPIVLCRYTQEHTLSPLHRHGVTQINYIVRGHLEHRVNNARYPLVPGDMFVIPPFIPHQMLNMGGGYEIVELEFQPDFVFGGADGFAQTMGGSRALYDFSYIEPFLVSECNVRPRLNLTGKAQVQAEELLEDMWREFVEQADGYQLAMKADLSRLLVLASRAFSAEIKNQPEMQLVDHHREAMTKTLRYIGEHYAEPITIEEVTRMALFSQSYFSYLFKALTGQTFVEYLHGLRLRQAMELLKTTDDRVIDICFQVGFNSINHFNRTFKSAAGVSPGQYRAAFRTG